MVNIPFMPKSLKPWIHPDTLILGVVIAFAGVGCTWFGFRTLFNHNDITINKKHKWQFQDTEFKKMYPRTPLVQGKANFRFADQ